MVLGFFNMFMLYGLNMNLNYNLIVLMFEIQQNYIIDVIGSMVVVGVDVVDVDRVVFDEYNSKLQVVMVGLVFFVGCLSWYKNVQGRVINNWLGMVDEYCVVM